MRDDGQRDAWHARQRAVPISTVLNFAADGLIIGPGTVLLRAETPRRLQTLAGQEARILALLSAAYGRAIERAVLANIERAAKAWREGDDCLAYIHLAHTRLGELQCPHDAAQRLVVVDAFLKAGASARTIFDALKVGRWYKDAFEKDYNPAEPRVPAGSGRTSGQWTRDGGASSPSLLSYLAPGAASWLEDLSLPAAASLGEYALGLLTAAGGAVAAFGILFIPSPEKIRIEGDVEGIPGLRYSFNQDYATLHLTYGSPDGAQRTFALKVDGDVIRNDEGKAVGRVIGGNRIVIDTVAVLPDLVKQDEPRLCPAYAPDVPGSDQGKPYEKDRAKQYEDFVKLLINPLPKGPTPSGYVYYLPNPIEGGKPVSFDDCEQPTGTILFEIKGEGIAKLTNDIPSVMAYKFIDQATRQMAAGDGRSLVWIFAEQDAALFARKLCDNTAGLKCITVAYIPWTKSGR